MATQKNQHYVPQFYQRLFSDDGKTIGTYVLEKRKAIPNAPIKTQGSADYFYTKDTGKANNLESHLGKMEEVARGVINKVIADPKAKLSKEDLFSLYSFTLLQMGRTVAQAVKLQETADAMTRQLLKKEVELKKQAGETGLEELTDEVLDTVSLNLISQGGFSVWTQLQMIPVNIDLHQKILINETSLPFITSDNPASLYNMYLERVNHNEAGLGCRGVFIFMPINPSLAVTIYDDKVYRIGSPKHENAAITQEKDIEELNKLTAVNSFHTLYYKPSITSNALLTQMASFCGKNKIKEKVEEIHGISEDGNPIIGTHQLALNCKLQFGFVKILDKYKAVTEQTFNPTIHMYREIAAYKDELIKEFFKRSKI